MSDKHYHKPSLRDYGLVQNVALPDAAEGEVVTNAFDAGAGIEKAKLDVVLQVPALATAIVPDTKTVTAAIESSDDATFQTGVKTEQEVVATGAGGAGIAAQELRIRPNPSGNRYFRGKVTFGVDTTDGSAAELEFFPVW